MSVLPVNAPVTFAQSAAHPWPVQSDAGLAWSAASQAAVGITLFAAAFPGMFSGVGAALTHAVQDASLGRGA
jgi:hypothetical protein